MMSKLPLRFAPLCSVLAGALLAACAGSPAYVPEEKAVATLSGRTAASYELMPNAKPQGQLRVASFGVSELDREDKDDLKAIHLRIAVSDNGELPMILDTREQRIQLPDGRQLAPGYATSGASAPPRVVIPPRSSRTVDLFFPIPEDLADASAPPRFDVIWRVQVGDTVLSRITPFDQVTVDPAIARQRAAEDLMLEGPYVDPYWGPAIIGTPAPWWY